MFQSLHRTPRREEVLRQRQEVQVDSHASVSRVYPILQAIGHLHRRHRR